MAQPAQNPDIVNNAADQGPKPFQSFVSRPAESKMVPFNAWSLAKASELAYKPEEEIFRALNSWGFECKTFGYKKDDSDEFKLTQAYIAWNDEIVVLSFRGTETTSTRDWLNNANIWLVKNGPFGSSVHRGFRQALNETCEDGTIIDKLINESQLLIAQGRALYITGHSLGAALATLAAAHFLEKDISLTGLYIFGAPRVGDPVFMKEFNNRARALAHRFVKHKDAIARMPGWRFGFRHVGEMWYINQDKIVSNPSWWAQVVDVMTFNAESGFSFAADHDLVNGYLPSLWNLCLNWKKSD